MTQDDVLEIYREHDALWLFDHEGDPEAPHALLTSGLHSDGYGNSTPVLQRPVVVWQLVGALVEKLRARNALTAKVDWVVGSPYAGITFSYKLAEMLGAQHGFAEKNPKYDEKDPNSKEPKFLWPRFEIPEGSIVLQCEELVTTLGTAMDVRSAIERDNPHRVTFQPNVACGIWRPKKITGGQIDIISLAAIEIQSWSAEECPLCARGSKALHPKKHWDKFVKK